MRQRLALAMALVGNPQFLILDEPLNGLDPEGIKDVRAIIAKLNEEYGVTIMISSHILSELQKVANHYGFLKNGVLIQEFSSSEIADTDLETFYFKISYRKLEGRLNYEQTFIYGTKARSKISNSMAWSDRCDRC